MALELATENPLLTIIAGGFLIGLLVGLTGVGAGALTTPMLIQFVGLPPAVAVGTDLLFASITKGSAAWRHHSLGNVNWSILKWLALGSVPGAAIVIVWLAVAQPETAQLAATVRGALAVALVFSAVAIVACAAVVKCGLREGGEAHVPARRIPTLVFGVVLGALVAITSVGAGAIGVTVLALLYPALAARRLVGTDIVHAIPLTFVSGLGHLGLGNVDFKVLGVLLLGSIPGIAIGSRLTGIFPDWLVRVALAIVLLNAAWLLTLKK